MKFSIIVSTFDHPDILELCLRNLTKLKFPKEKYEIILIDNNPENTGKIALPKNKNLRLKVIFEKKAGLAGSRNRGIDGSSGDFIGFIDDDALIDEDYLSEAQTAIEKHPEISVFGGPIYPFYTDEKPSWFKDEYESRIWGENERILIGEETFSGSNMIFRKDLFTKYGKFRTNLGMSGNNLFLGEETEFLSRLRKKGLKFLYIPALRVKHLVRQDKMNIAYQLKRDFASGSSKFVSLEDDPGRTVIFFVKYAGGFIVCSFLALLKMIRHSNLKQWLIEEWSPVFYAAGFILRALGINIRLKR